MAIVLDYGDTRVMEVFSADEVLDCLLSSVVCAVLKILIEASGDDVGLCLRRSKDIESALVL